LLTSLRLEALDVLSTTQQLRRIGAER